jgi:hypothetical protein
MYLHQNKLNETITTGFNSLPSLEQVWLYENKYEVPVPDFTNNPGTLKQAYINQKNSQECSIVSSLRFLQPSSGLTQVRTICRAPSVKTLPPD